MIVHDLSREALESMTPVDLATLEDEPESPIGHFDFHDCICGIASFSGEPPWEFHALDEMLHILAGECRLTVIEEAGEVSRQLRAGDLVLVPRRCWHRSHAPNGVTMLYVTPREGGRHSWSDPRDERA